MVQYMAANSGFELSNMNWGLEIFLQVQSPNQKNFRKPDMRTKL